jgi:hypothetical protein
VSNRPIFLTVDLKLDGKQAPSCLVSGYQPLLNDLLTSSIVLTEDFEKLPALQRRLVPFDLLEFGDRFDAVSRGRV